MAVEMVKVWPPALATATIWRDTGLLHTPLPHILVSGPSPMDRLRGNSQSAIRPDHLSLSA